MKKTLDKLQSKASDTQPHESCSADDQHADEPVSRKKNVQWEVQTSLQEIQQVISDILFYFPQYNAKKSMNFIQ